MRISDWSSDVCSSDLLGDAASRFSGFVAPAFRAVLGRAGQRRRTGPAATFPMKSYPLRVGDRGRLALAPERPHLGPFVQMGVSDDRARGLAELPMPEHIDQRCSRHGGAPRPRGLAAP